LQRREYTSENDQLDGYWKPGCSGRSDAGAGETARRHHPALHKVRSDRHRFYLGEWRLDYQGKEYPVSIDGLSVADVGISEASANGPVYNLKKLEDFNGTYTGVTTGATIGGGAGATTIQNQTER
jgi:hypothetical protein